MQRLRKISVEAAHQPGVRPIEFLTAQMAVLMEAFVSLSDTVVQELGGCLVAAISCPPCWQCIEL